MALSFNLLDAGTSTTDGTSFQTGSISPASDSLILVAFAHHSPDSTNGITGGGLTFNFAEYGEYSADRWVGIFRAMGSYTTGAVTFSFPTSVASICWAVVEVTGAVTTGVNGADAIVQAVDNTPTNSGTSISATMAAFASADNHCFAAWSISGVGDDLVPEAPLSELTEQEVSTENISLMVASGANDSTPTANWTSSSNRGVIALEIAAGSGTNATVSGVAAASTAAVGAPPKPRPEHPFSEVNVRL